jgi:hypothetical protein
MNLTVNLPEDVAQRLAVEAVRRELNVEELYWHRRLRRRRARG